MSIFLRSSAPVSLAVPSIWMKNERVFGSAWKSPCLPPPVSDSTCRVTSIASSTRSLPTRVLMAKTDACVEFSRAAAEDDARLFRLPPGRVFRINPVIDLERFNPDTPQDDVRASLGLDASHVVAAIVARVQRHRRWELLIEAVRIAQDHVCAALGVNRRAGVERAGRTPTADLVRRDFFAVEVGDVLAALQAIPLGGLRRAEPGAGQRG